MLPTAETASAALRNGYAVVVASVEEAAEISDRLGPEHLEIHVEAPMALKRRLKHYGGLFVGQVAAEVLGDYGAAPNHLRPTGGYTSPSPSPLPSPSPSPSSRCWAQPHAAYRWHRSLDGRALLPHLHARAHVDAGR